MMIKNQDQREPRKKSLQLFYSTLENVLDALDIEQRSRWLESVYRYEVYGELPSDLDSVTRVMFKVTADELDRNMSRFLETCERNKRNRNAHSIKKIVDFDEERNSYPEVVSRYNKALLDDYGKAVPLQDQHQHEEETPDEATPEEHKPFVNMMRERLKARDAEGL